MLDSEFKLKLKEISPTITVLEEYSGSGRKLPCLCEACGNIWNATPNHLLHGRGCPICSRKRSAIKRTKPHDVFINEVHYANPSIQVLSQYQGANTKVLCNCKICGHEWSSRPDHLIKGNGCPKCAGNAKKSTTSFVEQMCYIQPNIEILGEYLSADEKILCKCKICNGKWESVPYSLLSGSGCPHCSKRYKTSFSEQAFLFYVKQNFKDAVGTYIVDGVEFDIYIKSINTAIEYDGAFWHKSRLEYDNYKDLFATKNNIRLIRIRESGLKNTISAKNLYRESNTEQDLVICISKLLKILGVENNDIDLNHDRIDILNGYYSRISENSIAETNSLLASEWHPTKNAEITPDMVLSHSGKKFWWKCSVCNFEWAATPDSRARGRGCPNCKNDIIRSKLLKSHEQFLIDVSKTNTEIEIIGRYSDNRTPLMCKCIHCHNEFYLTPHDILRGKCCPQCTKIKKNQNARKTQEAFLAELQNLHPTLKTLDSYITAKHPIRCECTKCGYIWKTTPDRLHSGAGCPQCAGNARISHDEFVRIINQRNPNIEILGTYKRSSEKVEYRCRQCGYIGEMRASHLKGGHGCPKCAKQKSR